MNAHVCIDTHTQIAVDLNNNDIVEKSASDPQNSSLGSINAWCRWVSSDDVGIFYISLSGSNILTRPSWWERLMSDAGHLSELFISSLLILGLSILVGHIRCLPAYLKTSLSLFLGLLCSPLSTWQFLPMPWASAVWPYPPSSISPCHPKHPFLLCTPSEHRECWSTCCRPFGIVSMRVGFCL